MRSQKFIHIAASRSLDQNLIGMIIKHLTIYVCFGLCWLNYSNFALAGVCKSSEDCANNYVCHDSQCIDPSCTHNLSLGIQTDECRNKLPNHPYCALSKCRECEYEQTLGTRTNSCVSRFAERPYCAKYQCVQCPYSQFTAYIGCQNIDNQRVDNSYKFCANYKCSQCPSVWDPKDSVYCDGLPCKNYICLECANDKNNAIPDANCKKIKSNLSFCKEHKCLECADTNNLASNTCASLYKDKTFCGPDNFCVQCTENGPSTFCQQQYNQGYCQNGLCVECPNDSIADSSVCRSKYGAAKAHCSKYRCVECPNDLPIGSYDHNYCYSKYAATTDPIKRYCALNICVACPYTIKTQTDACPASKSLCQNYTCQQCFHNSDCATGYECVNGECHRPSEQCANCRTDAWCTANMDSGASCGVGKKRCRPRDNVCVECLADGDCPNNKPRCSSSNVCVTATCPSSCNSDFDCLKADCGLRTRCIHNTCTDTTGVHQCQPPNLLMIVDNSGSMRFTGSSLVNSGQPCQHKNDCRDYMLNRPVPYTPKYTYNCTHDSARGFKTCRFTRWDVAVSSLSNVIQNYGGSPQANYQDRYVRFGLIIFNSTATLNAPLYRDTPELIKILTDAKADGGTRYDLAFTLAKNHIVDALSKDLVPNRKTAIMFLTDGEPNEGCTAGPQKVKEIYELTDEDAKMRQIKTYVIGFGSGLGTAGENCLKKIAQEGHTNSQKCNTGRCLEFYAADSAADLADAFQDIINQATKEECNGMDNDCDGIIDNSPECSCVNSFTQPTSTSAISSTARRINPRVKLYTFISAFDIQGTCSPLNQDIDLIKTYQEACRNDTSKAISCSPAKLPNPPGNAYGLYCRRCCATTGMHCKWPQSHACSQPPWEKGKNDNTCMNNCKTWCKDNKQKAIDCLIPRGMLQRSDTGYNENGQLTVLRTLEFGRDVLNKQSQRWLFINLPSIDYRSKSLALRPVIAEVAPDNYDLPSIGGISWHSPDSSTWNVNHRFTTNNNNLTADLLGLAENCDSNAECEEDRQELIWTILGYNPSNGSSYRTHRLGAIYHSTPATSSAPSIVYPDVGYRNWIQTKIPAGKYTDKSIVERPTVIYVASNDGILHAFHADSGIELWGVIPATILHRLRSVPDGKDIDGSRLFAFDGSPLVQDVQLYRHIEQNEVKAQWMTVLIVGYRAGGRGYLALDVTNPYRPRLLWEINSDSLKEPSNPNRGKFDRFGYSYGQAFIANLLLDCRNLPASISTCQGGMQERAVAIIPGGVQLKKQLGHNILDQNDTNIGSVVYAVDLETGILLHQFAISDARGFASTPVGYAIAPAITTRVFVGDILGRLYRLDLQSSDPAQWTINLFYNLFPINNETPMPIMHAPSLALNERGEVVLFGGTGDTENINFVTGFDKVYSLREKLTLSGSQIDKVEAIPNYVARLNKVLTNEHTSNQPGPEVTIQSPKGERITGSPIIHNSTAYFTTYTPTTELPVCGIPGYSRVYGIHFNDQCRTANCFNALLSQQTPHFYHHILAYINSTVTPLKCCEQSGICTGNSNTPPSDQTFSSNPQTCGDLHYTVPMLPDRSTAPPHQYFRYLSVGANTLAMGVTFAYQPGETQVTQIKPGVPGHTYEVTHEGTSFLAFQIAGRNPSADLNFRLHHLRAIQPNIHPQLLQGNYTTIGLSQQGSPIMVSSWGSTLD